jgi:hypothetical protein
MRKSILFCVALLVFGCQKTGVEKPSNLIQKDKMVDILYDISLLEAVKSQNIGGGINSEQINKFIYYKYKIDSVQFVRSNKYYASDVEAYKKIYEKIKKRLEANSKNLEDSLKKANKVVPLNKRDTKVSERPMVY